MASLKYDSSAKALYVRIRRGKAVETQPLNDSVFVDLGGKGEVVGIEVILPKDLPRAMVKKIIAASSGRRQYR